ncbi:zinc-dependent alcohol dehydrogenase [Paraferrimonas haliotis]|uniref:Zn-dependent alcohol dehydrogenase n=1 Tax=Paraferrimonas haliotis TaxID=2013866 RepID=A0AA37TT07_9GAMM|nr:alcohol dehydrogenase catalytic domain-containing protein [Paraferrimonas haliotis]GLS83866.1 Zn-dependent alcohol dehydrogenase [Paraferrimonas haliotis]GLS83993.1 Zn-dependent alcohol dehydrogenase [Paraferrimonas haliotis]
MKAAQYLGNKSFSIVAGSTVAPASDEVRLAVDFVGICGTDMHIYHGVMDARVNPPATIGHELSATVAEVGSNVSDFAVGDRVVVRPLDYCGDCPACHEGHSHVCHNLKFMGIDTPGAFQNSWTVKARTLHKLPDCVPQQIGALVEPLAVACHDISRSRLQSGERAVVIGGGPIGQLIALVAKAKGAEVLLSEVNPARRQFAQDNGIDSVDPTATDIKAYVDQWSQGKGADVVFEVSGVQPALDVMTQIAAVRGRICMVAIHPQSPQVDLFQFFWKELEMMGARVYQPQDFEQAIELIATGQLELSPFISSVNPLEEIQQAFAGMDNNPSGMKALIQCQPSVA